MKRNKVNVPIKIPSTRGLPPIKPSTNITKIELLNLLKLTDIRKVIREIVYEILHEYEDGGEDDSGCLKATTSAHKELGPISMDIDVA